MPSGIKILLALLAVFSLPAMAADEPRPTVRPVTSAYTFEAGSSHIADTYLTPLHYSGWHLGIDYERFQAMRFNPERWVMRLNVALGADKARNPARNASMWDVGLRASWGMLHRWNDVGGVAGLRLALGGSTSVDLGTLYLARNGNNPVSVRAAWTVNLTGMAAWSTKIGRFPVILRYQPELPLVGAFFAPDYGELYYEISLGNRSRLAHCAWPGNRFSLRNLLTADFRFGATALRIGYSGNILSGRVNNITFSSFTHAVVVGISGEWLSINPRRAVADDTRIISAYY